MSEIGVRFAHETLEKRKHNLVQRDHAHILEGQIFEGLKKALDADVRAYNRTPGIGRETLTLASETSEEEQIKSIVLSTYRHRTNLKITFRSEEIHISAQGNLDKDGPDGEDQELAAYSAVMKSGVLSFNHLYLDGVMDLSLADIVETLFALLLERTPQSEQA